MDTKKLIEIILNDAKISGSKIYSDEPILKPASQLSNYLPAKYREMRKITSSHDNYRLSEAQIFIKQAKFMEDFEDDFEYHGEFRRYFPTYQAMNDLQLRGYFSWRTKVRSGNITKTSLSFVFVYIYELLNLIGVDDPEDAYNKLHSFWTEYRNFDTYIDSYLKRWLSDFVVYYNLDKSRLNTFDDYAFECHLMNLVNFNSCDNEKLFDSINSLSSYNLENSKFYKEYSDDLKNIVCSVFREYSSYYNKNRKTTLCNKLFGRIYSGPYYMFGSAVFYDTKQYISYEYTVNDMLSYSCKNGIWSCKKFFGSKNRNSELAAMLKAIDRITREKYNYSSLLKNDNATKLLHNIIEKEVNKFIEEKRKKEAPKIEIDFSKLRGIRIASEETRDKLIVDEEEFEVTFENDTPEIPQKEQPIANETPLTDDEYCFVKLLINKDDYSGLVKNRGILLSVVVDSVNEKLFDVFCDTVIIFDGETPEIVEDYEEELKGLIK